MEHNQTHTHTVGLPSTSEKPIEKAATCKTNNKHNRPTCTVSAGFETATPTIKQRQTFAFEGTTTEIGHYILNEYYPGTCFVRRTVSVECFVELGHRRLITSSSGRPPDVKVTMNFPQENSKSRRNELIFP